MGGEPADLFRDLESMQLRQVDIEQNQIRLQFFGLLNGLQPIRRLDGLELRPSLKRRTNETAERRMVLDDENPQRHMEESSLPCHRSMTSCQHRTMPNAGTVFMPASGITVAPPGEDAPAVGLRMGRILWQSGQRYIVVVSVWRRVSQAPLQRGTKVRAYHF